MPPYTELSRLSTNGRITLERILRKYVVKVKNARKWLSTEFSGLIYYELRWAFGISTPHNLLTCKPTPLPLDAKTVVFLCCWLHLTQSINKTQLHTSPQQERDCHFLWNASLCLHTVKSHSLQHRFTTRGRFVTVFVNDLNVNFEANRLAAFLRGKKSRRWPCALGVSDYTEPTDKKL